MTRRLRRGPWLAAVIVLGVLAPAAGCAGDADEARGPIIVTASTTYLADMVQNVAGGRLAIASLIPRGTDPHAFEPTPADLRTVAESDVVVLNGGGLEASLEDLIREAGGDARIVRAGEGLPSRTPRPGEPMHQRDHETEEAAHEGGGEMQAAADVEGEPGHAEVDPHWWLDPVLAKHYVDVIRDALVAADPEGAAQYRRNADAYKDELDALHAWIAGQIATIPPQHRKLVTNHASHGYFADRYGLRVVGAVIPGVSTGQAPSARQLADLVAMIRRERVRAVFVEADENPELALQVAAETGVVVVDDLLDHSLTEAGGDAPTYIDMLRFDTRRIVAALREP